MRDTVMLVELSESIVKELDEMLAFAMRYIRGEVINEKVSKLEIDRKRKMAISLYDRITWCLLDGASRERYMAEAVHEYTGQKKFAGLSTREEQLILNAFVDGMNYMLTANPHDHDKGGNYL